MPLPKRWEGGDPRLIQESEDELSRKIKILWKRVS